MKRTFTIALAVTLGLFVAGTAIAARNSSGTYALPLSPVVSGQPIQSTWANTTLSDLSSEITDSLSRSGKGGMSAPLRVPDGSSSAPTLAFTNETGTGWYRAGSSDARFAMGAVDRITVQSAAASLVGGSASVAASTAGGVVLSAPTGTSHILKINGTAYATVSSVDVTFNTLPIKGVAAPSASAPAATDVPNVAAGYKYAGTWTTLTVGGTGCSAGSPAPAYQNRHGIVRVRGVISASGSGTWPCTLSALPADNRPGAATVVPMHSTGSDTRPIAVSVSTAGAFTFTLTGAGTTYTGSAYLDSISFLAEN